MVVEPAELAALGYEFGPNTETCMQYDDGDWNPIEGRESGDDLTWRDTLDMNGTLVVMGFKDEHKHVATPMLGVTPRM